MDEIYKRLEAKSTKLKDDNDRIKYIVIKKMLESEEVNLKEWCEAHDVDYYAYDEKIGETIITLWAWDLCGE